MFTVAQKQHSRIIGALNSPLFVKCCKLAGVEPTKRQAGKFVRMGGAAARHVSVARRVLAEEKRLQQVVAN